MQSISHVSIITFWTLAVLFCIQPWFSRKNVLFGVVFPDAAVWQAPVPKRIIRRYIIGTGLAAVLLFIVWIVSFSRLESSISFNLAMAALLIGDSAFFVLANRQTRTYKKAVVPADRLTNKMIIDTTQSAHEPLMPLSWLLALLPLFLATIAVAIWGYPFMGSNIPTHYGLTGPDAWTHKSPLAVMQPLIFDVLLVIIILFTRRAPAAVKGNPNAAPGYALYRKWLNGLLILFGLVTELLFFLMELSLIRPVHTYLAPALTWVFPVLSSFTLLLIAFMAYLFFRMVRAKESSGPIFDNDRHWIWGLFYFNRSDPSLFIEKRIGIGYTVNMAHPIAWLILVGILAAVVISSIYH